MPRTDEGRPAHACKNSSNEELFLLLACHERGPHKVGAKSNGGGGRNCTADLQVMGLPG